MDNDRAFVTLVSTIEFQRERERERERCEGELRILHVSCGIAAIANGSARRLAVVTESTF